MPVHDWSEVDTNAFHHFHQAWALTISVGLNARLPEGYSALMEQRSLPMPTTRHAVETA